MSIPTSGGFFPTPRQRKFILKAIDHLMGGECDCVSDKDIDIGFEIIDMFRAIDAVTPIELMVELLELEEPEHGSLEHLSVGWEEEGKSGKN